MNIVRICYPMHTMTFCVTQNVNAKIQRRNYNSHKAVRAETFGWNEKSASTQTQ